MPSSFGSASTWESNFEEAWRSHVVSNATEKFAHHPIIPIRVYPTDEPGTRCMEKALCTAQRFNFGAFDLALYCIGGEGTLQETIGGYGPNRHPNHLIFTPDEPAGDALA